MLAVRRRLPRSRPKGSLNLLCLRGNVVGSGHNQRQERPHVWERLQPAGQLCDLFGCGSIYSLAAVASMLVKIGEMLLLAFGERPQIGRASCRERVCQYV